MSPAIIWVGIPSNHPLVPDTTDRKALQDIIDAAASDVENAGFKDFKIVFFGPEAGVQPLVTELQQRHIDGVVVGFGLRSIVPLTPFFEDIVNAVRETSPSTKLVFNSSIDNTLDAIKRSFSP